MLRIFPTLLVSIGMAEAFDGKCRILALRGGGVRGAYEVGAIKAFVENLEPIEYAYDYISGISVGALNAAVMAKYSRGEEAAGLADLLKMYKENLFSEFLKPWPYILAQAFTRSSILDVSEGYKFFDRMIGNDVFKRKISYTSANSQNS